MTSPTFLDSATRTLTHTKDLPMFLCQSTMDGDKTAQRQRNKTTEKMRSRLHCTFSASNASFLVRLLGSGFVTSGRTSQEDDSSLFSSRKRRQSLLASLRNGCTAGSSTFFPRSIGSLLVPSATRLEQDSHLPESIQWGKTLPHETSSYSPLYDFVIVGYGTAGQSALRTLRRQCPFATIALIDPLRGEETYREKKPTTTNNRDSCDFYHARAVGVRPDVRTVDLDTDQTLTYKHALLLATGSHGAPIPHYLMDEASRDRIYELRATMLSSKTKHARPILSPETVRRRVLQLVDQQNATVAILGSGWEAVELAAKIAMSKRARPTLIFGSHGPLCHILPNYLSTAVSKRLRARRVQVLNRSLCRYVSQNASNSQRNALDVFTAKSYDFLDGTTVSADVVLVAPDASGSLGSAFLATDDIPEFLWDHDQGARSWYLTWSDLDFSCSTLISCYQDDGRIAVNNEMLACSGVYAAGSVAKYANRITGHATSSGTGFHEASESGHVAAVNMARHCIPRPSLFQSSSSSTTIREVETKDPCVIWRSDRLSCGNQQSALSEMGIHALGVGNCDSDRYSTHAVWWTNQSAQRRLLGMLSDENVPQRKRIKKSLKFGLGVIFYHDSMGRIQGVMTWSLPFASANGELDGKLVNRMKTILRTNGGFRVVETDLDRIRMQKYLETEAKTLVATALSSSNDAKEGRRHNVDGSLDSFPRPLHRYSETRPLNLRMAGVVKRLGGNGHGQLGQDQFAKYENDDVQDPPPPYPQGMSKAESMHQWNLWEQLERRCEENESRARPSKEDPLWIRKGDETRNVSHKDRMAAAYNKHINPGGG